MTDIVARLDAPDLIDRLDRLVENVIAAEDQGDFGSARQRFGDAVFHAWPQLRDERSRLIEQLATCRKALNEQIDLKMVETAETNTLRAELPDTKRDPRDVLREYDNTSAMVGPKIYNLTRDLAAALRDTLAKSEQRKQDLLKYQTDIAPFLAERDQLRAENGRLREQLLEAEAIDSVETTALRAENKRLLDAAEDNFALVKGEIEGLRAENDRLKNHVASVERLAAAHATVLARLRQLEAAHTQAEAVIAAARVHIEHTRYKYLCLYDNELALEAALTAYDTNQETP